MAEEGTPPPMAELRAELSALKPRALKKRAAEVGVDEEKIDEADDADDVIVPQRRNPKPEGARIGRGYERRQSVYEDECEE